MKAASDEKSLLLFNSYSYSYVDVVIKLLPEYMYVNLHNSQLHIMYVYVCRYNTMYVYVVCYCNYSIRGVFTGYIVS